MVSIMVNSAEAGIIEGCCMYPHAWKHIETTGAIDRDLSSKHPAHSWCCGHGLKVLLIN